MIVDSSALSEQVVTDAISSAFDSAGQRCSALRVLCLQDDIADRVMVMLKGAMQELRIGDSALLSTDVGPVIDAEAQAMLTAHVARMRAEGAEVFQLPLPAECSQGTFFPPTLIAIPDLRALTAEVFGPVLHVVRFRQGQLAQLLDAINDTGYGLTHGVQTRIDETVEAVCARIRAGNIYVNRNIVGAVVGVQPFGGDRMSGTGPKAGGPHYLWRLVQGAPPPLPADVNAGVTLSGPTGETNTLYLRPRGRVACIADTESALTEQARAATVTGNVALFAASALSNRVRKSIGERCELVPDPLAAEPDAVLFAGTDAAAQELRRKLAALPRGIVPLVVAGASGYDASRLVCERTITINTTASGGNASLLSLTETPG
jgi:RHH-type transcriptional regulator, proline utilization regulon repressor / proline dehydrogenase / delta 1-pyrroline-5-carboxylate dehydrogenase